MDQNSQNEKGPPLPDLFPKIAQYPIYDSSNGVELEDIEHFIDDSTSVKTFQIREKLDQLDTTQWENKTNDKFFFTKLYGMDKNDEELSDFDNYNKLVQKEVLLENKTKRIIDEMHNNTLKISHGLDNRFDAGEELERNEEPQILNLRSLLHDRKTNKTFHEMPKIYRETTAGSNRTEVVDFYKLGLSLSSSGGNGGVNGGGNGNGNDNSGRFAENNHPYHLQRKLKIQQIQMIALGGTLGVGLFLNSGKAFSVGGPLGCFLGFLIAGSIVLATMLSFAEMSTLIPTTSSISGLASRFVEDAFGFALGWIYWLSFAFAMPSEVCAATIMLSYYDTLNLNSGTTVGFVTLFLAFIISVNLFDVKVYGNFEYCFSLFKVVITVVLIISMIVVNVRGNYGFKFWNSKKSTDYLTYGVFRPTFDLSDIGTGAKNGIGGGLGRFLGVMTSVLIASYAFTGSEIGFVAAMECRNPRKALPSVTKRVFGRIVLLYLLSIFLVGLNIYSGDPRLLRYFAHGVETQNLPSKYLEGLYFKCTPFDKTWNNTNGNQSAWIIALQGSGLCTFSSVLNAILVVFGVSAGSSHLYVSSRTLYSMAIQRKAFSIFKTCSKAGVPYVAVLFSGMFGAFSYLSVNNRAFEVFQYFGNISSAGAMLMWAGMCLSFLRFYYGLKLRPDIISRDDPSYPYRSPLQPFLAIYGLVGTSLIVIFMGYAVFLKNYWDVKTFFTSYGALILFCICYLGYKIFRRSKIHRLDQLDLDSGRREMDRIVWDEEKNYVSSIKETIMRCLRWLA